MALTATMMLGVTSGPVDAQDEHRSSSWLEAGLGGGTLAGGGGVAAEGQLAHQREKHLFSLRGSLVTDLADGLLDLGFLYGRAWSGPGGFAAASAGISLVDSDLEPSEGPRGPVYTWGVPVVLSAAFRTGGVGGLGIQAFANLNPEHSFAGVLLVLQLGLLP